MATKSSAYVSNGEAVAPAIDDQDLSSPLEGSTKPGSYVFELSEREKANRLFQLQYNVASNKYVRVSDNWEINGWESVVYESSNMFRKEEHDWKMAYLSRQEDTSTASIQWRFDFRNSGLVVDHVSLKATSTTFRSGKVTWAINCLFPGIDKITFVPYDSREEAVDIPSLRGCNYFSLRADLSGGEGAVAWQHAQIFRIGLDDFTSQPLDLIVHLADEMYAVEKVVRGKYINGKLHYLIKWKNYSSRENTWEPECHLNSGLLKYLEEHPVKITGKST